jgi:molecular chaperone GrpE
MQGDDNRGRSEDSDTESGEDTFFPERKNETLEDTPEQVEVSRVEADIWKENYARLLADFDNYRKRINRDLDDAKKFGNENVLKAFLPVLDNLERALSHFEKSKSASPEAKALAEGIRLTEKQFLEALEKFQVTRVPAQGEIFDPNIHEAIGFSETDEYPEGSIVDVFQQGYFLHNRLLRPSLVTVAQKKRLDGNSANGSA